MKKLILILSILIASASNTVFAAMTAGDDIDANLFFSTLASELNNGEYKSVWNGSNVIITADLELDDDVQLSAEDTKELKKAFAEGMYSSDADSEDIETLRNLMKKNNVHIIVNLMGSTKKVGTLDITWQDF